VNVASDAWQLTEAQAEYQARIASLTAELIRPRAGAFDEHAALPRELFDKLAHAGLLGVNVDEEYGGARVDHVRIGLMHHGIGTACSSVRSIITVHGMV